MTPGYQTITVAAGQRVLAISSMSARILGAGQWGANWAICHRIADPNSGVTPHNPVFSWFGDPSQNNSITTNTLFTLSPGTWHVGPCLAVEALGHLDYNSGSSTTILLINSP